MSCVQAAARNWGFNEKLTNTKIPRRNIDPSPIPNGLHLVTLLLCIVFLHGCAVVKEGLLKLQPSAFLEDDIQRIDFVVDEGVEVIGRLAIIRVEKGDTLPDIARHYSLGINSVSSANPGVDVWVPEAGDPVLLPLSFILPDAGKKGIVINLAAMRLFSYKQDRDHLALSTYPVGVGTPERPTPMGDMYIRRKKFRPTWYVPASIAEDHRKKGDPLPNKIPPGPLNPLGEHALYLNKPSYLIHGTNKPASIGLSTTNGCIRLYPEDIKRLFDSTPEKTPVRIVNQPFLIGQRDGVFYMEAHTPPEASGHVELQRAYSKLQTIEKELGHAFDWNKVKKVVSEARGFPVPISVFNNGGAIGVAEPIKLMHPGKLYGKPEVPELRTDAWYVMAAISRDKVEAQRLAAMINHQGPQIPARVLSGSGRHRVIAGPFNNVSRAKDAMKRLKIDLEIDGVLVDPAEKRPPG